MNSFKKIGGLIILFISTVVLILFVYLLIKLSFQNGESSIEMTNSLTYRIGSFIFDGDMTEAEAAATNRILRYSAHFVLFAALGYGLGAVGFLLFTRPVGRFFGIVIDFICCFGLSYYTEYQKQFIDGRHFQLADVGINMFGSIVGICFLLLSYILFAGIYARSKKLK